MSAPVCPVSRSQVPPGMPGMMQPFVPMSFDLPSAIIAANQANRAIGLALAPGPVPNNLFPRGAPYGTTGAILGTHKQIERWKERERHTNTIRFYAIDAANKVDKEQWVDVERIVYIRWHDTVQRIDLTFQWPYDPGIEGGTDHSMLLKVDGQWVVAPQ